MKIPRFGWPVLEGCGITEIGGYYAAQPLDPLDREGKAGAMGRPTKGTQVRLVEDG
jgi:long-subunit acyl-CoA synthetase (AMP-forming)